VFIIYAALFHNILLFLPVGAKFQQPIANANASSILDSTPSSTTSTAVPIAHPTQKIDPSITQSIKTIQARRITSIIGALSSSNSISSWWVPRNWVLQILICNRLSTLGSDGKWPDNEVDYTTGCAARRANWPAQVHWQRIRELTAFGWAEVIITHQL
jgi:hypothetical protein